MYIAEVAIKNFRSCMDVRVPLRPDVTVFAGETNAGKTTVIDGLRQLTEPLDGNRPSALQDGDLNFLRKEEGLLLSTRLEEVTAGQVGTYVQGLVGGITGDGLRSVAWSLSYSPTQLARRRGQVTWTTGADRELSREPSSEPRSGTSTCPLFAMPSASWARAAVPGCASSSKPCWEARKQSPTSWTGSTGK